MERQGKAELHEEREQKKATQAHSEEHADQTCVGEKTVRSNNRKYEEG